MPALHELTDDALVGRLQAGGRADGGVAGLQGKRLGGAAVAGQKAK